MLANYHAKVERKVFQLPLDLDPGEKLAAIAKIAVGSCPKAKTKTSFYNSTRYKTLFYNSARYRGGWSPHGSCQNATIFHGRKRRRRWLTQMDIATGIKEICDEWEKKLNQIPCAEKGPPYMAHTHHFGVWTALH